MTCQAPEHPRSNGALSRLRFWPVIDPRQSFTHKRGAVSLGEAVGNTERFAPLLIGQQSNCSGPIGAPHAAGKAESLENAGQRIPDVLIGEGLVRQRAGAADFDGNVIMGAKRQQLRQIGEWLCRRRRFVRLRQTKMVDYQSRIRVPSRQLLDLVEASAASDIHRQCVLRRRS